MKGTISAVYDEQTIWEVENFGGKTIRELFQYKILDKDKKYTVTIEEKK